MQLQSLPIKALNIPKPANLPLACFSAMFSDYKFIYKGKIISTRIISFRNKALRAIRIGDFLYIEQTKLGKGKWSKMARKGDKIMHIYNEKTNKRVASVINGAISVV